MAPSTSMNALPSVTTCHELQVARKLHTLQVACQKTAGEEKKEKNMPRTANVTELALIILVVGCGLTFAATAIAVYARGEISLDLPKAFMGLGSTLRMFGTSVNLQPSIFSDRPEDLSSPASLPVVLASPGNSITTVIRHGLSGSKPARKKGLKSWGATYEQAAPPEKLAKPRDIPHPVTTMPPSIAAQQSAVEGLAALAPPPALAAVEELQGWFRIGHPSFQLFFDDLKTWCLFRQAFVILLVVLTFVGLSLGLKAAARTGKDSKVSFDIKSDSASVKNPQEPNAPTEDDIMEAFDAFDRKRMGFIDRATVNHMLGHMALPGHLDAAAPFLGSVKKLFYDDFRRLALQPGPFADIVLERTNRRQKKMKSASQRAAAFDERCKFAHEVDAAQAAISAISQSLPTPLPCPSKIVSVPEGPRSWSEMRAALAPKASSTSPVTVIQIV